MVLHRPVEPAQILSTYPGSLAIWLNVAVVEKKRWGFLLATIYVQGRLKPIRVYRLNLSISRFKSDAVATGGGTYHQIMALAIFTRFSLQPTTVELKSTRLSIDPNASYRRISALFTSIPVKNHAQIRTLLMYFYVTKSVQF